MLKVVSVSDKIGTAIDRLCREVAPYHSNIEYVVRDVHPKRPELEQLEGFEYEARSADIIDFQYFRTAVMLMERFPWLKDKITVLTHNNAYSHREQNWEAFTALSAANKTIQEELQVQTGRDVSHIPLAADTEMWEYNLDWKPTKRVLMVANRIESKKGIKEVAQACAELGLQFVLVGSISDKNYFYEILQTGHVEFLPDITDTELRDEYYRSAVHVCNSIDDFESGTLPILEAMLCGTPVLSRSVGHVPEINNGENIVILPGQPDDITGIKHELQKMLGDPKKLDSQRSSAWNTAKNFNFERRAYLYQRLYRSLLPGEPVSVIMPVCDRPEVMRKAMNAVASQDYPNLELIVVDDSTLFKIEVDGDVVSSNTLAENNDNLDAAEEFARTVSFPVRFIYSGGNDYGLARARNMGTIEATGDILVFCDERMVMEPDCVSKFVENSVPGVWLYGDKSTPKKDFVENLSCIRRMDLVKFGMFNERCQWYGSMSQELRSRMKLQAWLRSQYVPEAKAIPGAKSSNKNRKRAEIIKSKNMLFKVNL